MEMCYDGALVMPKNYAAVTEEEMTYVEGGDWYQKGVYQGVKFLVNCAFNGWCGGGLLTLGKGVLKAAGTSAFKTTLKNALKKWVSTKIANTIAGAFAGAIGGFLSWSVGGAAAEWLDRLDGKNDNQIYFSKVRLW